MPMGDVLLPLRHRPFRRQFLAQAVSVLGDNVAPVAVAFGVLGLTGSASDLGLVLAANTASLLVFLLVGGVWADRLPRQRLMVSADLVRVATQLAFAALLLTGTASVWQLVLLQACNGAATAFFRPAATGLTLDTAPPDALQQANSLLSLTMSVGIVIGPALAGLLVATAGAGWAIALDGATFAVSALFLLGVRAPRRPVARKPFLADLRDGWGEVRSRAWVWTSLLNFMCFQLLVLAPLQVLGPLVADRSLGGATAWAVIAGCLGVGAVVGDLVGLRYQPDRPLRSAFALLLLTLPVLVALAFALPVWVTAIASMACGVAWSLPNILWFTALQQEIDAVALSRVSSYDWLGSTALRPVGYALAGPVAVAFGVRATLLVATAAYGATAAATVSSKAVASVRRRPVTPGAGAAALPVADRA